MASVKSEDTAVDESVHAADGAVVSPTVDFLLLLTLTLAGTTALTVLL